MISTFGDTLKMEDAESNTYIRWLEETVTEKINELTHPPSTVEVEVEKAKNRCKTSA